MLEYVAIAIIAFGLFLLIKGLSEETEAPQNTEIHTQQDYFEEVTFEERAENLKKKREVKAGGVVLIGPIPIVFGDSKYATYALILTLIIMLLSVILWVIAT